MIPIFDNGHGGVIGGKYDTPGKRSPNWKHGVLYEGMFNRWVINRLIEKMDRKGLPYFHVSPEIQDISLSTRVLRANQISAKYNGVYLISAHANAGRGEGIEVFTSPGNTSSDMIAEVFLQNFEEDLEGIQKFRFDFSDNDRDKEAKFMVLTKTKCPAILIEYGFMDHKKDYERLWSEKYLNLIVDSTFRSILELK